MNEPRPVNAPIKKEVSLPAIGQNPSKFSSWAKNEGSSLTELDDLLMEHDLLGSPSPALSSKKAAVIEDEPHSGRLSAPIDFDEEELLREYGEMSAEKGLRAVAKD